MPDPTATVSAPTTGVPTIPADTSSIPDQIPAPQAAAGQALSGGPAPEVSGTTPAPQTPAAVPDHRSFLSNMLHAVGDAFAPPTKKVVDPQTGEIKEVPLSNAQRTIGAVGRFLTAAGPALAQHGPGSFGRSIEAGNEAVTEQQKQQNENIQTQSKNIQALRAGQAARALQSQQMAESAWRMQREQTEIDITAADKLNAAYQLVSADPRNKNYGHYATFGDFLSANAGLQENGVSLTQLQAQGRIMAVPTTENGKITGVQVFEVYPDALKSKTTAPVTIRRASGIDSQGNVQYKEYTVPAGTAVGDVLNLQLADAKDSLDASEKAAQQKTQKELATSEEARNNAEAHKMYMDAQTGGGPVYAYDGQQTVLTTRNDALSRGMTAVRPVKETDIRNDQHDIRVLNDIQTKSDNVLKAASAMDQTSWTQAGIAAHYMAEHPNTTTESLLKSKELKNASKSTQDYIIAINSLRESSMGLQKVLTGSARSNETQLNALLTTLPGFEPSSDIVKAKLQAFNQNIGMLRQGLPTGTGIENIGGPGTQQQSQPQATHVYDPSTGTVTPVKQAGQ